jgi:chromosome segregation ATPase
VIPIIPAPTIPEVDKAEYEAMLRKNLDRELYIAKRELEARYRAMLYEAEAKHAEHIPLMRIQNETIDAQKEKLKECKVFEARVRSLERDLATATGPDRQELVAELEFSRRQFEEAQKELTKLRTDFSNQEAQIANLSVELKASIDAKNIEIQNIEKASRDNIDKLKSQRSRDSSVLLEYRLALSKLENDLMFIRDEYEKSDNDANEWERKWYEMRDIKNKLKDDLEECEARRAILEEEDAEGIVRCQEREAQLRANLEDITAQAREYIKDIKTLQDSSEAYKVISDALVGDLENCRKDEDDLKDRLQYSEQVSAKYFEESQQYKDASERLFDNLRDYVPRDQAEKMEQQIGKLEQQLVDSLKAYEELDTAQKQLDMSNDRLIDNLSHDLDERAKFEALQKVSDRLQAEVEDSKAIIEELTTEVEQYRVANAQLFDSLQQYETSGAVEQRLSKSSEVATKFLEELLKYKQIAGILFDSLQDNDPDRKLFSSLQDDQVEQAVNKRIQDMTRVRAELDAEAKHRIDTMIQEMKTATREFETQKYILLSNNAQLNTRVTELEAEGTIEEMRRRCDVKTQALQKTIDDLTRERRAFENENTVLKERRSEWEDRTNDRALLRSQLAEAETGLAQMRGQNAFILEERDTLREIIENMRPADNEIKRLRESIELYETDNEQMTQRINALQIQNRSYETQVLQCKGLPEENAKMLQELRRLRELRIETQEEIYETSETILDLKDQISDCDGKLRACAVERFDKASLARLESENEALRDELRSANRMRPSDSRVIEELQHTIDELRDQLQEYEVQLSTCADDRLNRSKLEELFQENERLDRENKGLMSAIECSVRESPELAEQLQHCYSGSGVEE